MEQNQFRIGGCYRDRSGNVVRLVDGSGLPDFMRDDYVGTVAARCVYATDGMGYGFRRLDNGMLGSAQHIEDHYAHLIPGEVNARGEPIETAAAAFAECAAASAANAAASAAAACSKETKRPALTWNKPTTADRWAGYVVAASTQHQEPQRSFGRFVSPDMQDNGPQTNPGFGSAALGVKG